MEKTLKPQPWLAWVLAARPKTLIAALSPVLIALSQAQRLGHSSWTTAAACLLAAVSLQVGVNFHNDACDGMRGVDGPLRKGPQRATAAGWIPSKQMLYAAYSCLGVAALLMLPFLGSHALWLLPLLSLSLAAAIGYTGTQSPLGYRGLGELLAFCFFGPAPVIGASLLLAAPITMHVILLGCACGLYAASLMLANNIRDIEEDWMAGKLTLAVQLGAHTSILVASCCLLAPGLLMAATTSYLPLAAIPFAAMAIRALISSPAKALPLVSVSYLIFTCCMLLDAWI